MDGVTTWLLVALTAVLIAEFINGWTDAPNAIATVVSTGVLTPRIAIVMAVVLNTLGAMAGTAVAATVGKGIVEPGVLTLPAITAAMCAIIVWGTLAARLGIPVSKSHALLAGLAGAGFAGGGLSALAMVGLGEGRHRPRLLDLPGLPWRTADRQARHSLAPAACALISPSALSTTCRSCRPLPWPSTTASTTVRSSWAYSR